MHLPDGHDLVVAGREQVVAVGGEAHDIAGRHPPGLHDEARLEAAEAILLGLDEAAERGTGEQRGEDGQSHDRLPASGEAAARTHPTASGTSSTGG